MIKACIRAIVFRAAQVYPYISSPDIQHPRRNRLVRPSQHTRVEYKEGSSGVYFFFGVWEISLTVRPGGRLCLSFSAFSGSSIDSV